MTPMRSGLLAFAACAHVALAQVPPSPVFQAVASQPPNGATVSDPTIRPMQTPGNAASIFATRPIDFQGNGRPDLFICYGIVPPAPAQKMPCRVLRPQVDGSLVDVTRALFGNAALPGAVAPKVIVTGDFNKDGRPDVFIAAQGWDAFPFPGEVNVLLLSNADGTYTDRSSTLPQTPDFTHDACVGDIDGDGNLDVYVGNVSSQTSVGPYFLMGRGDGTFAQSTNRLPPRIAAIEEKFTACALVDVDQDGKVDLVLGTHGDAGFLKSIILLNNGAGDFSTRPRIVLPPGPLGEGTTVVQGIGVVDINGDGKPDLIITSSLYTTFSGLGIQVLINQGGGNFTDESTARLGSSAARTTGSPFPAPRFAELNGDGRIDFYFSNGPPENVPRYFLGNASGGFSAVAPNLLTQGAGFGVSALHFDGDGRIDLVQLSHSGAGDVIYKTFLNATPGATSAANYSDIWWNPAESGWGLTLADHQTQLFAVWYTYRQDGSPTWFVIPGGTFTAGRRLFSGDIYQTTGPPYTGAFDSAQVRATKVGNASFDFEPAGLAAGAALFTYTVGSVTRSKQIQRQPFGNAPTVWGNDLTDIYWDPAESGWGLTLSQHGNNIFAVWYTYDATGQPLFVVMPGVVFNADGSITGSLYTTTGPYYGNSVFDPLQVRSTSIGTATLEFDPVTKLLDAARKKGRFVARVNGRDFPKWISPQGFGNSAPDTPAPACEILYFEWSRCVGGSQSRIERLRNPAGCSAQPQLTRSCTP
jgi:hypothetical protein